MCLKPYTRQAKNFSGKAHTVEAQSQSKQPAPAQLPQRFSTRVRRAFLARCSRTVALFKEMPVRAAWDAIGSSSISIVRRASEYPGWRADISSKAQGHVRALT